MALKNLPASILARLKNQSKEQKIAFQVCLQLFFQEEFLRRLSLSDYKENLILKGGMFIYTLTEFDSRPTRDMDFLVRKLSGDLQNIQVVMTEICNVKTENDFLIIEVLGTEQITLDKRYPGVSICQVYLILMEKFFGKRSRKRLHIENTVLIMIFLSE